jgi:hypothetical protein
MNNERFISNSQIAFLLPNGHTFWPFVSCASVNTLHQLQVSSYFSWEGLSPLLAL